MHAFNLVLADDARAAADADRRRVARGEDPGAAGRCAGRAQGQPVHARASPTTCSSRILEGWCPPYDATGRRPQRAARARSSIGKTNLDEFAMGSSTENSAFGPTRNPHDLTPGARRFERRLGGRGGGRRSRSLALGSRHRWLDPPAGRAVRRRRREADVRRGVALRPHRLRLVARPDRPVRGQRRRRGAAARSDRRSRRARFHVDPAAAPSLGRRARRRCRRVARRHHRRALGRGHRSPTCWRDCTRPPTALEDGGREGRARRRCRRRSTASPRTT